MIIQKVEQQAQVEEEEEERIKHQVNAPPLTMSQEEEKEEEDDDDYEDDDDEDDCEDEDREEEILITSEDDYDYEDYDDDEERDSSAVIPTSDDSPYMVIQYGIDETEQTFYSISKGIYCNRSIPELYGSICCAFSNGWLVTLDNSGSDANSNIRYCSLLNSVSLKLLNLPSIKTSYKCDYCILTSSPPDCVVMFLSFNDNSCLFCRPNDKRWTRKILGRKYGDGEFNTEFQVPFGAVSCQGKIYINYGNGRGMKILKYNDDDSMIIGNNRFTVEKIEFNENLMNSFNDFTTKSRTYNYLVESNGEVFLVVRNYIGSTTSNTYSFSVYRLMNSVSSSSSKLQGGHMVWKKVESLGNDRVFFLDRICSYSVSASKSGLMENHIYFFHPVDHRYLYRFSIDNGSIYKTLCFPHVAAATCRIQPYWMISNSIL